MPKSGKRNDLFVGGAETIKHRPWAEWRRDGIDKAGDLIDEKTSGKFSETIDKVQGAAQTAVDKVSDAATNAKDAATGAAETVADKVTGAADAVADKVDPN